MPTESCGFQLALNLTARLSWSMQTIAFVHKWRQRARSLPPGESEEHLADAALVVLSAVEQLDDRLAETLGDLYRATGHLPAPGDRLLVGPLQLRVEDRQWQLSYPGGQEQVALTYCFAFERYRYESLKLSLAITKRATATTQPV